MSLHNDGLSGGPPKFYAFSTTRAGTLVVGSCVRGLSRSVDGGNTWLPNEELAHVSVNAFAHGLDASLLAATSGGLWRSSDDAVSWEHVDDRPRYALLPDAPEPPTHLTVYRLLRLGDGRTLAATDGDGLWVNREGQWSNLALDTGTVYSLAETDTGTLLVGTRADGVVRSDDGGATWSPANQGMDDLSVHCLLERGDGEVLSGTGQGIFRSVDDGRSWAPYAEEVHGHRVFALCALADGRVAVGSYTNIWIGEGDLWRHVDPGLTPDESWSVTLGPEEVLYAGTKSGVLCSDDQGATWAVASAGSVAFAVTTNTAGDVLAAGDAGVLIGPDWRRLGELGHRAWAAFEVAPGNVLAATLTDGLYQHFDGEWRPLPNGPPHWQVYCIMRSRSGRIVVGTGAIDDGEKVGSIFTSDDDARSWAETLSGKSYYTLAQTSDGTMYAGGRRCRISRSTDDGDTWEACPLPLGREAKMYSLFADRHDRLFLGAGGQLLRSDDGATTWTVLDQGLDGVSVYDLCEGPGGLLVAATSGGLFASDDEGSHWRAGASA